MNGHVRTLFSQWISDKLQALISSLRRMHGTVSELSEERMLRGRFGDDLRQTGIAGKQTADGG
jgi:hypothetical protein